MAGHCPGYLRGRPAFGGRDHSTVAAAWRGLETRMAADAGLKAEVEVLRVAILAAGRAPADEDPTLRHLALAALDQARIAEHAVARWRSAAAALYAALEAHGHVEGQVPDVKRPEHRDGGVEWRVAMKPGRRRLLGEGVAEEAAEKRKGSVRAKVEHPFLYVKRHFGYAKVRYRGVAKNRQRIALLLGFSNLLIAGRYATG